MKETLNAGLIDVDSEYRNEETTTIAIMARAVKKAIFRFITKPQIKLPRGTVSLCWPSVRKM